MAFRPGRYLILVAVTVLASQSASLAQMPQDEQFVRDIRAGKHGEALSYLVNGGPADSRDFDGVPAIVAAAEKGDASMVRSLLEYGANPNLAKKKTGETALIVGAARGNQDIVSLLIYFKADLDSSDKGGESALIKAARAGYKDIVGLLLAAGADHEIADYTGLTPYDYAVRNRQRSIVQLLESVGAGP